MSGKSSGGAKRPRGNAHSTRLAIGPEDAWRSWRDLPGGAPDPAATDDDDEDFTDVDDATHFAGSMMVVEVESAPADPALPVATVATPAPVLPSTGEAPGPTPAPTPAPASGKPRVAAPSPPVATPSSPKPVATPSPPTPVVPEVEVEAEAAPAAAPVAAPAVAPPPPAVAPAGVAAPPVPAPALRPVTVATPVVAPAPAPARVAPAPTPVVPPPVTAKPVAPAPVVADYVLDSDPAVPRVPGRAAPDATPSIVTAAPVVAAERPRPRRATNGTSTGAGVDDAVARLEARVAHHEQATEDLLAELHARYAGELARLDSRLRSAELGGAEPVPADLEDRVQSGFMELVVKLEALERQVVEQAAASTPAAVVRAQAEAAGGEQVHRSVVEAITSHFLEQSDQLETRTGELEHRVQDTRAVAARLDTNQKALAERQLGLEAADAELVATQRQLADDLAAALERLDALTDQVSFGFQQIPRIEHRVKSLESRVDAELETLRTNVEELAARFPAVEEAAELVVRNVAAVEVLEQTLTTFTASASTQLTELRNQLAELDGIRDDVDRTIATTEETRTDFLRLQAEVDRRSNAAEGRLAELEDVIGNEAGVDRQLLLDRIEEMERGISELDPDRFATRTELDQIRTRLPDPPVDGR